MHHMFPWLAVALWWVSGSAVEAASEKDGLPSPPGGVPSSESLIVGQVVETMDADRYTYVLVDTGTARVWVAGFRFPVGVGDRVVAPGGFAMREFRSRSLERTFEEIYFASPITVMPTNHPAASLPPGHPGGQTGAGAPVADSDIAGIETPAGGVTVAEVHARKEELAGREVVVRGKVVKFTASVMGKNWIHLQDGSGREEDHHDLAVATKAAAGVGDIITVRGRVAVDRDLGFGYLYSVLLEDAVLLDAPGEQSLFAPSELRTASGAYLIAHDYYEAADCGECHVDQHAQWNGSLHRRAHGDSLYLAFARLAREEGGDDLYRFCSSCHAAGAVASGEIPGTPESDQGFLTHEGVTCEVCHNISRVRSVHAGGGANASFVLEQGDARYGPIPDPVDEASHESVYSELQAQSRFCSSCHTLVHPHNGLVIENTFAEWKAGPYAEAGIQCQDCHMRTAEEAAVVARTMKPLQVPGRTYEEGEPRPDVHAHLFVGGNVNEALTGGSELHAAEAERRLQSAATLALKIPERAAPGDTIRVEVAVTNVGAGHAIPTSITELRQVWIDLEVADVEGDPVFRSGEVDARGKVDEEAVMYHAVLADENGEITYLPWRAEKMISEKLIPPRGTVREPYTVAIPDDARGPLSVRALLRYRSAPQEVLDELFGPGTYPLRIVDMAAAKGMVALGP